jgi:hypothetical protein
MQRKQLKESAPRQHNHLPTGAEWRLLEILWGIGDGTVESSMPILQKSGRTIRLPDIAAHHGAEGFIEHECRGPVFVFRPLISRKTIDHRAVQLLLSRNFGGSATRSTGEIEEGPVGFSVTNLDHDVVSWRFQRTKVVAARHDHDACERKTHYRSALYQSVNSWEDEGSRQGMENISRRLALANCA